MNTLDKKFNLPAVLRILGTLAVVGSGLIYMLQGLENVDLQLRSWAWLLLMLVLTVGGFFSFSLLEDRKGARLFFALAALVIPVQVSQLGGMVFNFYGGGAGNLFEIFQFTDVSNEILLLSAGLSLLAAIPVAFAAFSILARPHARWLALVFICSNLLILIPVRTLPFGLLVLAAMLAMVLQLERKIFSRDVIFKTLEGNSTRLISSLPLLIVFVRAAFHQQDYLGLSILAVVFAIALIMLSQRWLAKGALQDCLQFFAWLVGAFGGFGLAVYVQNSLQVDPATENVVALLVLFAPFIAWTTWLANKSSTLVSLYRLIATLASALLTVLMLKEGSVLAMLCCFGIGTVMIIRGYVARVRVPIILGALVAGCSLFGLCVISIQNVQINVWLALAISGVALVALSSVTEKYGRRWLNQSREHLESFSNWPA